MELVLAMDLSFANVVENLDAYPSTIILYKSSLYPCRW